MSILSLLGWAFVGKEAVKETYINYQTNNRGREIARSSGNPFYVDRKGKLRMLSNNKKVYSIEENGHIIYRYVDSGAVAFDATEYAIRQDRYSTILIAEKWGKKVIPLKNKERERIGRGYYGMEIKTKREFWVACIQSSDYWYKGSDNILTTLNEEKKAVKTRLTMDEADEYRGLELIRTEKSYESNDIKDKSDYLLKKRIEDEEKDKKLKEERLWAKNEHILRMKRLYGENWEERLDTRGREDRIIYSMEGPNLSKEIFYFLYNKYYPVRDKGWEVYFDERSIDGKAWFTLGQLISEFLQRLFDKKESDLGYIRVTDVTTGLENFDPFNLDSGFRSMPLRFILVCDKSFPQKLLEGYKKYYTEYKAEYAEEYKKMIEKKGLSKVACSHETYIENVERNISNGEAFYAESFAIWYMLCDGDMSRVPELEKELEEYIKSEMSLNETWKANYEKGVELANEQKKKARDNENQPKD